MTWLPAAETVAQIAVERILNPLPEGLLVAIFAWALLRVLPRQNAGTRFAVWFTGLLTVAALPLLGGAGQVRAFALPGISSFVAARESAGSAGSWLASSWFASSWFESWSSLRPAFAIPAVWGLFVFVAWALGAGVALLRLAVGLWRLRDLRRNCTPVVIASLDPAVRETIQKTMAATVASTAVTIATSESVRVPAAIGFFHRTIVLPAWALRELEPANLNVVLLHELAHLRRWDDWTNLFQKIVGALFFFHPAVWWIESRLSVEREMACDDAVLAETANPHGYAACLVSLLEKNLAHRLGQPPWSMAHAAVNRAGEAALRLARILDRNRPAAARVWKPALGMAGAFSVICLLALPHAPQWVAFDHGPSLRSSKSVQTATVLPANGRSGVATVQPEGRQPHPPLASLRTAWSRAAIHSDAMAEAHRHAAATSRLTPPPVVNARWNAPPTAGRMVDAGTTDAGSNLQSAPQFRTLLFVEATEYTTANSSVWSVQVWQVMLLSPVRERLARVPVASKI